MFKIHINNMACGIKPKTVLILTNYRFKNHLRNMSGVNLEKSNSAKQQNKSKKNLLNEDDSVQLDVYPTRPYRYQICTDRRSTHKLILEKPRYEQENFLNVLRDLQPARMPHFFNKPD